METCVLDFSDVRKGIEAENKNHKYLNEIIKSSKPKIRFFSKDDNKYLEVVRINVERNSFTVKVDNYYMELDNISNIEINGVKIKDV